MSLHISCLEYRILCMHTAEWLLHVKGDNQEGATSAIKKHAEMDHQAAL
jgi:hypothetical protein